MSQNKIALLFGATGLVGSHLQQLLENDARYSEVKIFTRRKTGEQAGKIKECVIDFEHLEKYEQDISGDDLFCCLGTTIKKAKTKSAFRKVDLEYPREIAAIASKNKVHSFSIISSLGADAGSSNFYLKTKGEMEGAVRQNHFERLSIVRPSILLGARDEFRLGETIGKGFMKIIAPVLKLVKPFRKYAPIHARTVAAAMIELANQKEGKMIYESDEVQEVAKGNTAL